MHFLDCVIFFVNLTIQRLLQYCSGRYNPGEHERIVRPRCNQIMMKRIQLQRELTGGITEDGTEHFMTTLIIRLTWPRVFFVPHQGPGKMAELKLYSNL